MKVKNYGIRKSFPDRYIVSELLKENGITVEQITEDVEKMINKVWVCSLKDFNNYENLKAPL